MRPHATHARNVPATTRSAISDFSLRLAISEEERLEKSGAILTPDSFARTADVGPTSCITSGASRIMRVNVEATHEQGFVHHELKPANTLRSRQAP